MPVKKPRRKPAARASETLRDALENGHPVKGMKGWIYLEHLDVYIPVTLVKVEITDCTVTILAEVKGGIGQISINACEFIESREAVDRAIAEREAENRAAELAREMMSHPLITQRRRNLEYFVNHRMTNGNSPKLLEDIESAGLKFSTMRQEQLVDYARAAISLETGVDPDKVPRLRGGW